MQGAKETDVYISLYNSNVELACQGHARRNLALLKKTRILVQYRVIGHSANIIS